MSTPASSINPPPPEGGTVTDFNDAARARGHDAVRERIAYALEDVAPVSPFRLDDRGVWYCGAEGIDTLICDPLHVLAQTRDRQNQSWGRLLEWHDADGNPHRLTVPVALCIADSRELGRLLAENGLNITPSTSALQRLAAYIMEQRPKDRARCVSVPGWHEGRYVLPTGECIGGDGQDIAYQHTSGLTLAYGEAGDWRANVAVLCAGNSRLVFAICCVLAGPMLHVMRMGGGGFHFVGDSSTGKSTLLKIAASVAGAPELVREWRTTANGLEGVAVMHNDATIILDEMAQISAQEIGEAAYLLANGQGKSRSSRNGDARPAAQWNILILSAGEVGLSQHMASVGKRTRAGQAVRLVDIPAAADANMGAFEFIHDADTPAAFSAGLRGAAADNYGTAWRPWLECLAKEDPTTIRQSYIFNRAQLRKAVSADADGQVLRVIDRFALAATAGELATRAKITGWEKGEAYRAAESCMHAWLRMRGGVGNADRDAMLRQVRAFFETHGEARFEAIDPRERMRHVQQRAGFFKSDEKGHRRYLVLPEAMKEICNGYDGATAKRWLIEVGWLEPANDGRPHSRAHVPGIGKPTVYNFNAAAVHGGE